MNRQPRKSILYFILISASILLLAGCIYPAADTNDQPTVVAQSIGIKVGDRVRDYLIYTPPFCRTTAQKCPAVLIFHGGGGTAKGIMKETAWAELADSKNFIAVFPEGTPPDTSKPGSFLTNPQSWNDGSGRMNLVAVKQDVDDVAFVSAILADLKAMYHVDETRLYVTGFSNGASMSFRLARELSQEFAAFAPVSGADWLTGTIPANPVPIFYITGTDDPLNPMEGGDIHLGQRSLGIKPPVQETIDNWIELHGYTMNSTAISQNDIAIISISGPKENPGVILYAVKEHGHHWPGGNSALPKSIAGPNAATINATDIIWEFFKQYSKQDKP